MSGHLSAGERLEVKFWLVGIFSGRQFADPLSSGFLTVSFVFNNLTGPVLHRQKIFLCFHMPIGVMAHRSVSFPFAFIHLKGSLHSATLLEISRLVRISGGSVRIARSCIDKSTGLDTWSRRGPHLHLASISHIMPDLSRAKCGPGGLTIVDRYILFAFFASLRASLLLLGGRFISRVEGESKG
jgi:hypothetical protein